MKKLKLLLSLSILFFALYSCSEQLEVQDVESIDFRGQPTKSGEFGPNNVTDLDCGISCPLIAGQSIDAGTVTVTNDDENLYVTVFSTYGFQQVDENIKMSIGDIAELPSKRPPAGHFDYKWTEVNGDGTPNTHTFTIALEGLEFWDGKGNCESAETSTPFYIILHADVLTKSGSSETAFGGCIDPDTKGAWWYYMEYAVSCCEENDDEYAFLYKGTNYATCYNNESINGFSNVHHYRYYRTLTRTNYIYTNSDNNCDILSDSRIGNVTYSILDPSTNDEKMNFHFVMDAGTENYEYEIYMGWENPIENGALVDGINFDKVTPNALEFDFEKPVNDWGDYPLVDGNTVFYVIVKVKMIK